MRADKLIFFCILVMSARLRELVDVVGTTRSYACGDLSGRCRQRGSSQLFLPPIEGWGTEAQGDGKP